MHADGCRWVLMGAVGCGGTGGTKNKTNRGLIGRVGHIVRRMQTDKKCNQISGLLMVIREDHGDVWSGIKGGAEKC